MEGRIPMVMESRNPIEEENRIPFSVKLLKV